MLDKSSYRPVYVCLSDSSSQNHLIGNISQILEKRCLCMQNNDMTTFSVAEITVVTQLAHSGKGRERIIFFLGGAELMYLQGKSS